MEQGLEVINAKFEEYRRGHEREHDRDREAIELQNTENLRRLDELNHAHAQAVIDKAAFLTIAVFDARQDAIHRQLDSVQKDLGAVLLETASLRQQVDTLRHLAYGAVGFALLSVGAALLQLVVFKKG